MTKNNGFKKTLGKVGHFLKRFKWWIVGVVGVLFSPV